MKFLAKLTKWSVISAFLLILFFMAIGHTPESSSSSKNKEALARDTSQDEEVVLSKIDVDMTWRLGGFNTVAVVDFKIKNSNSFPVKDLVVECLAYGKSGTRLGKNKKTIFQDFPAEKVTTIKEFSMGLVNSQVNTYGCSVVEFSR